MNDQDFIELQDGIYGLTSQYAKSQLGLPKRLELCFINETAKLDLSAFQRSTDFRYALPEIFETYFTAGTGLPVRLIAYYDRAPIGYAIGVLSPEDKHIAISYWELSRRAPQELHREWITILLMAMTDLANGASVDMIQKIERLGFTSPDPSDIMPLSDCGFEYSDNFFKGISGCYVTLKP